MVFNIMKHLHNRIRFFFSVLCNIQSYNTKKKNPIRICFSNVKTLEYPRILILFASKQHQKLNYIIIEVGGGGRGGRIEMRFGEHLLNSGYRFTLRALLILYHFHLFFPFVFRSAELVWETTLVYKKKPIFFLSLYIFSFSFFTFFFLAHDKVLF
jgi:hypothetical protein